MVFDHTIRYAVKHSSWGEVLVAATEQGICRIDFDDTPEILLKRLKDEYPQAILQAGDPDFSATAEQVLAFLEFPREELTLPLDMQGTAFQRKVWTVLQTIPPGLRVSYTEIAQKIGRPRSVRAVASAGASNRIAVAIPCHRVVRKNGDLAGYRWGIERKKALLEREGGTGGTI